MGLLSMKPALVQNNYLPAKGFLSQDRAEVLAVMFCDHVQRHASPADPKCPASPAAYNFMPFVKLLVEKTPEVGALIGESVLPTYAYARVYRRGEVLVRHRDRAACEISVTINLRKTVEWPIHIQTPDGTELCFEQNPGDAMLYLGCVADHWRDAYEGDEHVQVFLHYVRADGPKAWAYFDKEQEQAPSPASGKIGVVIL